jgi:hypothetical protein
MVKKTAPADLPTDPRKWGRNPAPRLSETAKMKEKVAQLEERVRSLNIQLGSVGKRVGQIDLLSEVEKQLKTAPDQKLAAQLVANAIQRTLDCDLVTVLTFDLAAHEYSTLAVADNGKGYPHPDSRQPDHRGLLGKATRLCKSTLADDTNLELELFNRENPDIRSEVIVPLMLSTHLRTWPCSRS